MTKPSETFFYFAYGSNLLAERLRIQNESAVRKSIARLDNYRLDFNRHAERWGGCTATFVEDIGKHVWGAVWEMSKSDIPQLDKQEGVLDNIYKVVQVTVKTPENEEIDCRVYQQVENPSLETTSDERRPSRIYLEVILQGAVQSKLPQDYIDFLKTFRHNGYSGPVQVPGLNVDITLTT